jgi:cell division protein FtsI (penicillin-binding protein 3)
VINARSSRRRLALTVLALFATIVFFAFKLVDIQVVRAAELNEQSLGKRSVAVSINGARGDIIDADGVLLASSVDRFDITASPKVMNALADPKNKNPIDPAAQIVELAAVTGESVEAITASLAENPESDFAYISKLSTLAELTAVKALEIPWVYYEVHPSRTYPNGAVAGNLIGFLGTDGPGAGLELDYDACLASTNGSSTYEKSKDGVRLPGSTVTTRDPVNGGTLRLTIDTDLQWYTQEELEAQAKKVGADWGTAIVVRVSDGHIMALADYPSVDPNNVDGVPITALGSLAFSTPYEPGSTFKPMTAAMLIDQGVATPTSHIIAPGRIRFANGQYIKDVFSHGDLRLTLAGVLMNSSNTGISKFSDLLSQETRYDYFTKFGIGQKTAVGFPGESAGSLPEVKNWDQLTNYTVAFGQGVSATSAQMASVYQTLGNNGVRVPLTLVEGCTLPDGTVIDQPSTETEQVVSESAADQTVLAMETIASKGPIRGLLSIPGYRIAAKTGTAEVAESGVYTDDRIVSVAGLIPAENPEYAVIVTLGKPDTMKTSTAAAAPFRNIMTQVIKTFRIVPSQVPAPDVPVTW